MNQWFGSKIKGFAQQGSQIPVRLDDMERLESAIGFNLPDDYKSILCECGGFELADGANGGEPALIIDSPYEIDLAIVDFGRAHGTGIGAAFSRGIFPIGAVVGLCSLFIQDLNKVGQGTLKCVGGAFIDSGLEADYEWDSFSDMLRSYLDLVSKSNNPVIQFHREGSLGVIEKKRDGFEAILKSIV